MIAWIKVALPLLALALLSTLFLFARAPDPDAAIPFADVDLEEIAREQRLTRPRFASTLIDGREVTFMADDVVTTGRGTDALALTGLEGRIALPGEDFLIVDAEEAAVNLQNRVADLADGVRIVSSLGYAMTTDALSIGFEQQLEMTTDGAVDITGPGLDMSAGQMTLSETESGAAQVHFTGGVRLLYDAGE